MFLIKAGRFDSAFGKSFVQFVCPNWIRKLKTGCVLDVVGSVLKTTSRKQNVFIIFTHSPSMTKYYMEVFPMEVALQVTSTNCQAPYVFHREFPKSEHLKNGEA